MQKQLLLSVSFVLMVNLAFSQANYKDLILGIPECEQKVLRWEQVKNALKTLNGIKVEGICSRHDIIILSVNRDIHTNNQAIFDKIKGVNASYRIFEKIATKEEIMQDCAEEMIKQKE